MFGHRGLKLDTCTATRIEKPVHDYLENTVRSMQAARQMGADVVEIDIAPTKDGQIAVFHDWTVDCRTNGKGNIRDKTMAELKQLDPGIRLHGGRREDLSLPWPSDRHDPYAAGSAECASRHVGSSSISRARIRRKPISWPRLSRPVGAMSLPDSDIFYGAQGPVERIKQIYPDAWAWSKESAKACTMDYA